MYPFPNVMQSFFESIDPFHCHQMVFIARKGNGANFDKGLSYNRIAKIIVMNIKKLIASMANYQTICDYLPSDHSIPCSVYSYLKWFYAGSAAPVTILDLGCGEGNSIKLFQRLSGNTIWHGVDIENSPEVKKRVRNNDFITSFNGVDLPYPDNYFDLIFSNQVLEHVRSPDALITDAFRVLKPGGSFIGSVSYLEPYHSYSIFNFTPYGIVRVFNDSGFDLKEIRPETDAAALIIRQLVNRYQLFSPLWKYNFLYVILEILATISNLGHRERNFLKIQFSGHLVFLAKRPDRLI